MEENFNSKTLFKETHYGTVGFIYKRQNKDRNSY